MLTESVLPLVVNLNTSYDVWKTLVQTFASYSRAQVLQLKAQLQMIQQGDSSIDDYIQSVNNIVNNLAAIGHSVTELDILMHILADLNTTYDSLVPTIITRVDDFSVEEVHGILSSHERLLQLKSAQSTDTSFPSINTAGRSHSSSSSFNLGGRGGHGGRGQGRSRGKGRCQICLILGHYADECYKRFDQRFIGGLNFINHDGSYAATQPLTSHNTIHVRAYHSAITSSPGISTDPAWFPDSGASHHVTPDYTILNNPTPYMSADTVQIGNGTGLRITNLGDTHLPSLSRHLHLKNILHVPSITKNLLSVRQFTHDNNVIFEFHPHKCFVKDQANRKILLRGGTKNSLYHLPQSPTAFIGERTNKSSWHARLGHPSLRIVHHIICKYGLPISPSSKSRICSACMKAKSHKLPFSLATSASYSPLELIYSDIWGPAPIASNGDFSYYVIFVGDFSKFTLFFPMKYKSDLLNIFLRFW
ncbi:Retrovirus-related Pol polyprotein from transposon TNT 1-94 [Apostasia shenzhenica]|uniref:Retrovirus-related Pol polyprotein from transposon TNT 1-94 n=1 Tax=Apostasia shenzhenica TaxID=1088818 RepID=A0A2I0A313_9ASPA|nr:Retrovirus-related Pol polyprotein from transposon TNT 1-94 [Apostasia shenzhenica]